MRPKVGRVANCQGVSERDPREEALLALTKIGSWGVPDIVFFSEISWLDLHALVAEVEGWHAIQHGRRGSPEAGVGIAARAKVEPLGMLIGSKAAVTKGAAVRMRPIVGAEVWSEPFWAIHAPTRQTPEEHELYLKRARCCRGTMAGDWNEEPEAMRQKFSRNYRGVGVLGALTPQRLHVALGNPVNINSDHPAPDFLIQSRGRRAEH